MSPFYCSPDSFDCKDFSILLYVAVCMNLCDWHWTKLIQKSVAYIKRKKLQNMKSVTQERQLQQVTEIWNYFAFMEKSFLHDISPFCSVSWHLPLRLLWRDSVQTLLPPFVYHWLKDNCRNVLLLLNTVQCQGLEQSWLPLSDKQVSTTPSGLLPGCRETS